MPPERLDAFMARANAAYYATHNPFADFTTAPEISQVFGECLGAWAAITWQQLGAPTPFLLVECGPGRGTLMADILRTTAKVAPAFHQAAKIHLIETSPTLRAEQASLIPSATWHNTLETLPPGQILLLANEFLDALPIRQFIARPTGWHERHVEGAAFIERPANNPGRTAPADTIIEIAEAATGWVTTLCQRLTHAGGAALILDYGTTQTLPGESLQALHCGQPADPLQNPGAADLTAHVDFANIARLAKAAGSQIWGPIPQGIFLQNLGITQRTIQLAAQNPHQAEKLHAATQRLIAPTQMGLLFKAICLACGLPTAPPGFPA